MALDTSLYPAQGRLILSPTNYTTGGTDLGLVAMGHNVGVEFDVETFTRMETGSTAAEARITGVNAVYSITMLEYSASVVSMFFRGMQTNTYNFKDFNGYNLGNLVGSSQTFKLQIRPVNDDGTVDSTKPHLYIPRGMVISIGPFSWDRQVGHIEGTRIIVLALKSSSYTSPFLYGDPATLPAIA